MTHTDVLTLRLHSQRLAGAPLAKPEDVVRWLGAVQAQEYPSAKWAIGARARRATDAAIDEAFDAGRLLRTHVMRPTWHFVLPADIRWMLDLSAPRVKVVTRSRNQQLKLDEPVFERANAVIAAALRGGRALTRAQLASALREAGITSPRDDPQRLTFIVLRAELDGVVCSGPRAGKQLTYALLDERVPRHRRVHRDDARAELARRYFLSHGPATVRDFMWWSGLTSPDARAGLDAVRDVLVRLEIDGKAYWGPRRERGRGASRGRALLLTTWDECFAYRDRAPADPAFTGRLPRNRVPMIVIDGVAAGTWRAQRASAGVIVEATPYRTLNRHARAAIAREVERYGQFLGTRPSLRFNG